jgi:hypothetical protein
MNDFAAYHIRVRAKATSPLVLREYVGSALRGAFFGALWRRFCTNQAAPTCAACPLNAVCPVSALVAPLRDEGPRGRDIPRLYAMYAPRSTRGAYGPGDDFSWGLTLFGRQRQLFPYVVMAVHEMAQAGLGLRCAENGHHRGRFSVEEIAAINPLTGATQTLQAAGARQVAMPDLPVTAADIAAVTEQLPVDRLTLRFHTPARLTDGGQLVHRPEPRPLVQRLLERLTALMREFGDGAPDWDFRGLIDHAATIRIESDQTHWIDLSSYSSRQRRATPIGGFVGEVTYTGDLRPLLPLLVWGSVTQIGKDTVKGNGVYQIIPIA